MKKDILVFEELDHSQYFVTDFNEYGEEVETTLPENVRVYSPINQKDIAQGMRNASPVQM